MLAEVTVVRNPTALKKEMPKGFVQSNIIIVTIVTLFFLCFLFSWSRLWHSY